MFEVLLRPDAYGKVRSRVFGRPNRRFLEPDSALDPIGEKSHFEEQAMKTEQAKDIIRSERFPPDQRNARDYNDERHCIRYGIY